MVRIRTEIGLLQIRSLGLPARACGRIGASDFHGEQDSVAYVANGAVILNWFPFSKSVPGHSLRTLRHPPKA